MSDFPAGARDQTGVCDSRTHRARHSRGRSRTPRCAAPNSPTPRSPTERSARTDAPTPQAPGAPRPRHESAQRREPHRACRRPCGQRPLMRIDPDHVASMIGREQQVRRSRTALLRCSHCLPFTSRRMLFTADRPTTSRLAPLSGANAPYQARPILEGTNRGRHFVRKTPKPGSQSAFESGLGSTFDPTRTGARAGTDDSTPGVLCSASRCRAHDRIGDVSFAPVIVDLAIAFVAKRSRGVGDRRDRGVAEALARRAPNGRRKRSRGGRRLDAHG